MEFSTDVKIINFTKINKTPPKCFNGLKHKNDYKTYYRGEEEPFYYKSIYHTSQYLLIFNILILDYNISIFQYIYLTLSLHLPFFIALSIYCFIGLLLYLFIAVYISVFQYLFIQISLNSNIFVFQYI